MAGFFNATAELPPEEINPLAPETVRPRMITSLKLTPAQEDRMVQRALDRIDDLRSEMGMQGGGGGISTEGWMWEREKNQMQYDNEWEWRKALKGIFEYSNFSLNLSKRYARLMAAKCTDDLVGTDPFFSFMPTEQGGKIVDQGAIDFAKSSEWYVQQEVSESNAKRAVKAAQKTALIRNECVVKMTWVNNDTQFVGPGMVAVGPFRYTGPNGDVLVAAGDPVMTPKGEYIYQKDNVFDDPNVQGMWRLEKEPGVASRYPLQFAYFESLQQTLRGENGLSIKACDYRDFLCPLNAASVHEADICVHTYDEQWERLKATYTGFDVSAKYVNQAYMAGEKQPKTDKGEQEVSTKHLNIVNCADVYMRFNPFEGELNDPGIESEVWILVDLVQKKAIWYDYLGNHMSKRPFEVIPGVECVPNRWYGVGVFEMLQHKQLYVDTQFNRVNFKSTKSASVRFRVKNSVAQWKAGEKLVLGDDKIYDIEDPRFNKDNPPLFAVNLTEIDEFAMQLIELMIQAGSTEVGIVGPDDGAMAGLDTTKLATGIKSLERTGNLLMKFTEEDHADAIRAILDQAVDIILEHMDEDELIFREDTGALLQLNRSEIRRMKDSVTLLLTRSRSTDTIETARMVIQLVREYYEALNPFEQYKLRPEYLRQLKALETPDAANLLDEVTLQQVEQWRIEQAKAATLLPKTSIATNTKDLYPSERAQVLAREGIQAASPEEIEASKKDEAKQEGEIAGATAKAEAKFAPKTDAKSGSKPKAS